MAVFPCGPARAARGPRARPRCCEVGPDSGVMERALESAIAARIGKLFNICYRVREQRGVYTAPPRPGPGDLHQTSQYDQKRPSVWLEYRDASRTRRSSPKEFVVLALEIPSRSLRSTRLTPW